MPPSLSGMLIHFSGNKPAVVCMPSLQPHTAILSTCLPAQSFLLPATWNTYQRPHPVFPLSTAPAFTTFLFLCSPISPPRVQCPLRWGRMRWEEPMWTKVNSTTKLHTEGNVLQAFISSLTTKLQHATPDSELPPPFSERHQALRCNDSGFAVLQGFCCQHHCLRGKPFKDLKAVILYKKSFCISCTNL